MPQAGTIFVDWQQAERDSRLLIDEDFSWSEPPRRSRTRIASEPLRVQRSAVSTWHDEHNVAAERDVAQWDEVSSAEPAPARRDLDDVPRNRARGRGAGGAARRPAKAGTSLARSFDLSDRGGAATPPGSPIAAMAGRGEYQLIAAARRNRDAGLRLHERSGFSPDRAGLWAVLLGIALVIGAIVH